MRPSASGCAIESLIPWPGGGTIAWAARFFLVGFGLMNFSIRTIDPDFWGHLAIGQLIWMMRDIPRHDVFSYLPTRDWVNYEWLTNVAFYPLFRSLGDAGILAFKTCAGIALMGIVYASARKRTISDFPVVLLMIPAVATIGLGFAPRAQIFTYLLFAIWLALLELARGGSHRVLFALPIMMTVWANLHAGFLSGLAVLFVYTVAEAAQSKPWRGFAVAFAASLVATLINPYGLAYWNILLEGTTIQRPYIEEWMPVPLNVTDFPFFKLLTLLSILLLAAAHEREEITPILVVIATCALAWKVRRHMPLFGIAAAALVPQSLAIILRRSSSTQRAPIEKRVAATAAIFLVLGGGLNIAMAACPDGACSLELDRSRYQFPARAIDFMQRNHFQGNLAVEFRWALFAAWNLYPNVKTSVDGRYETVFDPAVIAEDLAFFYGEEPHRFLRKYHTDFVLTDNARLRTFMDKFPRAQRIFSDGQTVLYRIKDT